MNIMTCELCTITNPNSTLVFFKRAASSTSTASFLPFKSLVAPHHHRVATVVPPRGLGFGVLRSPIAKNRSIFTFAASSHEDSKPKDIEVDGEKNEVEVDSEEFAEAWNQTLASFKEQALKMQSMSREAYELYSKKAMVVLKLTSKQLKIRAEKARQDLSAIAKEISEEGKEYLSIAAEKSPEHVKDIVETFASSTDAFNEVSKVRDFYLGIPYGVLLSVGGFLSFMLTESISAIRFGVIPGAAFLALSISSLRSWKKGESFPLALKGQAVIASVLFLKEISSLILKPSFATFITTFVSGAMVAFYVYRISMDARQTKGSELEPGTEN